MILEGLFGNKNVARIMLYLFVNGTAYGTELHRALAQPLTPLQKALDRLEKAAIISSFYEGKRRLYQFNPSYPLHHELELLLKKSFSLLPAQEKRQYYNLRQTTKQGAINDTSAELLAFWNRLSTLTTLSFHARNHQMTSRGEGTVAVTSQNSNQLIFTEKGTWSNTTGENIQFRNVFCWTLDRLAGVICLEHLRRGPNHPELLFHLAISGKRKLSSVDSHISQGNCYIGKAEWNRKRLHLSLRVIGKQHNDEVEYFYA